VNRGDPAVNEATLPVSGKSPLLLVGTADPRLSARESI